MEKMGRGEKIPFKLGMTPPRA